jgi:IS5 family transposase
MRRRIHAQLPIVQSYMEHDHAKELEAISEILDSEPEILGLVHADLVRGGVAADNGREGMTAEQVLRALVVKQMNGFSYEELSFHLADSRTYSGFCRLGIGDRVPSKKTLQRNIKRLRAQSLEAINRALVRRAAEGGMERGRKVRVDCTVTETDIHPPSDSSLLWDCVRVLVRLMRRGRELVDVPFTDHSRRAKRRWVGIQNARSRRERVRLYKDLLKVTHRTLGSAGMVAGELEHYQGPDAVAVAMARGIATELREYIGLALHVVSQTERRVVHGEVVSAEQKIVSIFEPHTDIIKKDRREPLYGHKLCLCGGASGLISDCIISDGNPADSSLAVEMIERQEALYGRVPRQAAFDGGFASRDNLKDIKGLGVKDVAFHKRRGLTLSEMVKSTWVYRRLHRFRAGIEGIISFLKRCFGLWRCSWRSLPSFKSYVWSSIVSANLLLLARHRLQNAQVT